MAFGGGGGGMGGGMMKFMQMFGGKSGGGGGGMGSMMGGMMGGGGGGGGGSVGADGFDHSADWSSPGGGFATSPMVEQYFGVSNADPGGHSAPRKGSPVQQPFQSDGGNVSGFADMIQEIRKQAVANKIGRNQNQAVGELNSVQRFPQNSPQQALPAPSGGTGDFNPSQQQIDIDDLMRGNQNQFMS